MNKHEQETQQKTQEERRTKQKNKNQKTTIRKNTDLAQCTSMYHTGQNSTCLVQLTPTCVMNDTHNIYIYIYIYAEVIIHVV